MIVLTGRCTRRPLTLEALTRIRLSSQATDLDAPPLAGFERGRQCVVLAPKCVGERTTMPNAEVAANQGALLGLIGQLSGARRVLEFGTLADYSTIWFARAVGPEGKVVTFDLAPANAAVAREDFERASLADRTELIEGSAADSAERLIDDGAEPFDLVFIDTDKPSNPLYLKAAPVRDGAVADAGSDDPRVIGVRDVVDAIAARDDLTATALQTVGVKG